MSWLATWSLTSLPRTTMRSLQEHPKDLRARVTAQRCLRERLRQHWLHLCPLLGKSVSAANGEDLEASG